MLLRRRGFDGKNFISATQELPKLTSGQKEKDVVAQCAAFLPRIA